MYITQKFLSKPRTIYTNDRSVSNRYGNKLILPVLMFKNKIYGYKILIQYKFSVKWDKGTSKFSVYNVVSLDIDGWWWFWDFGNNNLIGIQ